MTEEAREAVETVASEYVDDPHEGHFTLWGTYYCDTCESPYCELA